MQLTKNEMEMIFEAIYLTFLLDLLETYSRRASIQPSPLRELYIEADQLMMNMVHADLVQCKSKLKDLEIKYIPLDRTDYNALHFQVFYRGYDDSLRLHRDNAKAQLSVRLGLYMKKASDKLLKTLEYHR